MALTTHQKSILELLANNRRRTPGSYVAGGLAFNFVLGTPRVSRDIDIFHDTIESLFASWTADRQVLESAGYEVTPLRELKTFIEATVTRDGQSTEIQWGTDSAYRFFPLQENATTGFTLHPLDLAANKLSALVGRTEPRDWIDVIAAIRNLQPLACLLSVACGKDPGFSPVSMLEYVARRHYNQTEIDLRILPKGMFNAAELCRFWHEAVDSTREVLKVFPPAETGKAVMNRDGTLFNGTDEELKAAIPAVKLTVPAVDGIETVKVIVDGVELKPGTDGITYDVPKDADVRIVYEAKPGTFFGGTEEEYEVELTADTNPVKYPTSLRPKATTAHIHCECGTAGCTIGGHAPARTWTCVAELPTSSGYYVITNDIDISTTWHPASGTFLCLNGHVIANSAAGITATLITNSSGETLTLVDCATEPGKIAGGVTGGGTIILDGGAAISGAATGVTYGRGAVLYVSADGNDSTGTGSADAPYATLAKAYAAGAALTTTNAFTIALMSDITAPSGSTAAMTVSDGKHVTLASADADGKILENEAGDYAGVYSVKRGSNTGSLISLNGGDLTIRQAILDGENTSFTIAAGAGTLIYAVCSTRGDSLTLDTNCILRDNRAVSPVDSSVGGAVDYSTNGKFVMKSNAAILGCTVARHGGAVTTYKGDMYLEDDAMIAYNGIEYTSGAYYGGSAILAHGGNVHVRDRATIAHNYVHKNGVSESSGRGPAALLASGDTTQYIYVSDDAQVWDNLLEGQLTRNADGTYVLTGGTQANVSAKAANLLVEGELGTAARIGITVANATSSKTAPSAGLAAANGTSSYTVTEKDVSRLVDDTRAFKLAKNANAISFAAFTSSDTRTMEIDTITDRTVTLTLSDEIDGLVADDFLLYVNGEPFDADFTIVKDGTTVTLTFPEDVNLDGYTFGVKILNGTLKVNGDEIVEKLYTTHVHDGLEWKAWDATDSLPTAVGNWYLKNDVQLADEYEPANGVNLCLCGRTVTAAADKRAIMLNDGVAFNLYDCAATQGSITGGSADFGAGVYVASGATFGMYGGTIGGNTATTAGGGVYALGTVTLGPKATILDNKAGESANNFCLDDDGMLSLTGDSEEFQPTVGLSTYPAPTPAGAVVLGFAGTEDELAARFVLDDENTLVRKCLDGTLVLSSVTSVDEYMHYAPDPSDPDGLYHFDAQRNDDGTVTLSGYWKTTDPTKTFTVGSYVPGFRKDFDEMASFTNQNFIIILSAEEAAGLTEIYTLFGEDDAGTYEIGGDHEHCVCGGTGTVGGHVCTNVIWKKWREVDALPTIAGNWYLTENVTLAEQYEAVDGVALDLAGHTVTQTTANCRVVYVPTKVSFTLTDCIGGGTLTGGNAGTENGGGILNDGTFTMFGGEISGNTATRGGGIQNNGTLTLLGGTIADNDATSGGGISSEGGMATIYGGVVIENEATTDPALNGSNFDIYGGIYDAEPSPMKKDFNAARVGSVYVVGKGVLTDGTTITEGQFWFCPTNAEYVAAGITVAKDPVAEGTDPVTWTIAAKRHCICGDPDCDGEGEGHEMILWNAWPSTTELPNTEGNWYLTDDYTLTEAYQPVDGVKLDLNGHVIQRTGEGSVIKVASGRTFTLTDSGDATTHNFAVGENGLWTLTDAAKTVDYEDLEARPAAGAVVAVKGGVITGGRVSAGGGVNVEGTFVQYAGNIVGNSTYNTNASCGGGGVRVVGTYDLKGGCIIGNLAYGSQTHGGGISVLSGAVANITGGDVTFNYSANCGGGIMAYGSLNMGGGTVSYNEAGVNGGGINVQDSEAQPTVITGGTICGNMAVQGSGIFVRFGALTLIDTLITGNTATVGYGAVGAYLDGTNPATITVGGETVITGNTLNGGSAFNLYLQANATVSVSTETPLAGEAKIGVTTATTPTEETPVAVTTAGSVDSSDFFTSDDTTFFAIDTSGNVVKLSVVTNPIVKDKDGTDKTIEIPKDWKEKFKPTGEEIMKPKKPMQNGLPAWQNYVLGIDPTNELSGVYADAPQNNSAEKVTLKTKNVVKVVDGYSVKYRLDKKLGSASEYTKGDNQPSADFDVALNGDDPTGIYKLNVVIMKDDNELDQTAEAINTVGIVKATNTNKYCIIAVPWNKLAPGEEQDIAVSNVIKTANLEEGDKLHVYRHDESLYDTWTLNADKVWDSVTTYKINKDGTVSSEVSGEAAVETISRGNGVWLERKNPTSNPYFLCGQHNTNDVEVIVEKGHNLLAAPGITAWDLSNITGATSSDYVLVPGAEPKVYTNRDGKWGYYKQVRTERKIGGVTKYGIKSVWTTTESTIPAGTGFWLINKSGKVEVK